MRELNVNELTGGSKLMNILRKSLPEAKDSFFYKMLRKKNITLNNKKATGSEIVSTGDVIKFFLSDETYDKFAGKASKAVVCNGKANGNRADDSGAGDDKLNHGSVAQVVGRNVKPNVMQLMVPKKVSIMVHQTVPQMPLPKVQASHLLQKILKLTRMTLSTKTKTSFLLTNHMASFLKKRSPEIIPWWKQCMITCLKMECYRQMTFSVRQ